MRRDTTRTADDLNRPEGNDLVSNYDVHDIGEAYTIDMLNDIGLRVESWGMDKRHDKNGLLFEDDKVDLKVFNGDELVALVEVKTKTSNYWMGKMNERHYIKYRKIASEHSVPTYVVFYHVDDDEVVKHFFVPIHLATQTDLVASEFRFPDGNKGVFISSFYHHTQKSFENVIGIDR